MTYQSKLRLSKLMICAAWLACGLGFFFRLPSPLSHRNLTDTELLLGAQACFGIVFMALFTLPLGFLLWSKLHGTGRSVRMACFVIGPLTLTPPLARGFLNEFIGVDSSEQALVGVSNTFNSLDTLVIFVLLVFSIFLSLRRKKSEPA